MQQAAWWNHSTGMSVALDAVTCRQACQLIGISIKQFGIPPGAMQPSSSAVKAHMSSVTAGKAASSEGRSATPSKPFRAVLTSLCCVLLMICVPSMTVSSKLHFRKLHQLPTDCMSQSTMCVQSIQCHNVEGQLHLAREQGLTTVI